MGMIPRIDDDDDDDDNNNNNNIHNSNTEIVVKWALVFLVLRMSRVQSQSQ
jgi:hypothetical protein